MDTKVTNSLQIEVPQGFVDEGDGVVSFPNGLTITDGTWQRNGTLYDIDTLDITKYSNQLTADHEDKLHNLIGRVEGVQKQNGRVTVNKIRYAVKENPYARLAYDLLVGGFSRNFSTETIGPQPDHNRIWFNSELVGLSQVVTQNNYNAHINQVVHNSLEQAKKDGLDITGVEEKVLNHVEDEHKMEENTNKETETQATETKVEEPVTTTPETKVEEVKTEETTEKAPVVAEAQEESSKVETVHVPTETEAKTEETQTETKVETNEADDTAVEKTTEETKEETNKETKMEEKDKTVETPTVSVDANALSEAIKAALAPFADKISALETAQKNAFDASAKEPEFKKVENEVEEKQTNAYAAMDFETRYQAQVDAAWNAVKIGNIEAWNKLREINQVNLDLLKKEGIAKNAITLEDLGNFVIAPEMYNEIQGVRTDYQAILNVTEWRETNSLEFAWLERTGDIDMRNVALHETDEAPNGNLKPISEYAATPRKSELEELAAVTVVATSLTRFAAVDLLADAAAGYRNDYDRKRAQLVIAKLEDAVDQTGFSAAYNPSTDVDALTALLDAITEISDTTLQGTLIFNAKTLAEVKARVLRAGANGPLSEVFTTGDQPTLWGYRYVVVPNDLMPSLGGSEVISHNVFGVPKRINHAVFFADLTTFTGRTSGGLQYDVSNSASYENGGVVKSAYQRNELVLRGSFFRGGAVKDVRVVSGIRQGNSANLS